jgi:hypothetical protein
MGHWGVRSYENDGANDALDSGFERACGNRYEELMDDHNPLSFDQVQKRLANQETLLAAVRALEEMTGAGLDGDPERWDELARLAFAGVVVRYVEFGVAIPGPLRLRAIDWLEHEEIEWHDDTKRRKRREKEISLLRRAGP